MYYCAVVSFVKLQSDRCAAFEQIDSMYDDFAARTVMDFGCGTVRLPPCHASDCLWMSTCFHIANTQEPSSTDASMQKADVAPIRHAA